MERYGIALLVCVLVAGAAVGQEAGPLTDTEIEGIIEASPVETIYVVASSHWDFGFAGPSDVMADRVKVHIDQVIECCEGEPELKWTVESTWQVLEWLRRTPEPAEQERLFRLVREGRVGIGATFGGMSTAWMGPEEMCRLVYAAERLRREHSLPIDTAIMDDVPGYSWALPQTFSKSGVTGFLTGVNTTFGGKLDIPRKDNPFLWEGADGSRVLTHICHHYHEAAQVYFTPPTAARFFAEGFGNPHIKEIPDLARIQRLGIGEALRDLAEAGYERDAALTMFAMDFIDPRNGLTVLEWCRKWNAEHQKPRLIQALPSQFFSHVREAGGEELPVYRGDWSGLWESGSAGAPQLTAYSNRLREAIGPLDTVSTVAHQALGEPYLHLRSAELTETLLQLHEHGLGVGTGWPNLVTRDEVEHNNRYCMRLAEGAAETAEFLLRSRVADVADAARTESETVVVFNALSWQRSSPVTARIPRDLEPGTSRLVDDATDGEVVYQAAADGITFVARDIPSVGFRRYRIERDAEPGQAAGPRAEDGVLTNGLLEVKVDEASGHVSEVIDLVADRTVSTAFGRLLMGTHRQGFFGQRPEEVVDEAPARVEYVQGLLGGTVRITREEGPLAALELNLYTGSPELHVRLVLDRSKMPYAGIKDHSNILYAHFGFELDASRCSSRFDGPAGFIDPVADFLPGAFRGTFVVNHVAEIAEEAGPSVAMACRQAGIVDLGGGGNRSGSFSPGRAEMLWKLMARADEGNSKDLGVAAYDVEPGAGDLRTFDFALRASESRSTAAELHQLGQGFAVQLVGVYSKPAQKPLFAPPPEPLPPMLSFLTVEPENVVLLTAKQASFGDRGDVVLRFMEVAGEETEVVVKSHFALGEVRLCDMVEGAEGEVVGEGDEVRFGIAAREVVTVRARG